MLKITEQRGFTLVELLAVMAIMAILTGVVAGAVVGLGSTGQATRLAGDRNTIAKSADRFFTDAFPQTYPVVDLDTNGDGVVDDLDDFDLPGGDVGVRLIDLDATLPQDATRSFVPDFLKEVPDSAALVSWRVDTATGNVFFAEPGAALVRPSLARLDVTAEDPSQSADGASVQSDHIFTLTMRQGQAPINIIEMTIPAGYVIGGQQLDAGRVVGSLAIEFDANNPWNTGNEITVTEVPVVVVSSNRWKAVVDYDSNISGGDTNIPVKNTESEGGTDERTHTISIVPPSGDKSPGILILKFDRVTENGSGGGSSDYEDPDVIEATETFTLTIFDHPQLTLGGDDVTNPVVNVITNPKNKGVFRWLAEQNTAIDIEDTFDGLAGKQAVVIKTSTSVSSGGDGGGFVLFQDDFDAEVFGATTNLTNWFLTANNVDVLGGIPTTSIFDFYPGNGNYLDMEGTPAGNATITTKTSFSLSPGTYELSFEIGNNPPSGPLLGNALLVSLGGFSQSFTAPLALTLRTVPIVVLEPTTASLVFSETGPVDASGSILNDVKLEFLGP